MTATTDQIVADNSVQRHEFKRRRLKNERIHRRSNNEITSLTDQPALSATTTYHR